MRTPTNPRATAIQRFALIFSPKNKIENITTQIGPEKAKLVTSESCKFRRPTKIAYIATAPTNDR